MIASLVLAALLAPLLQGLIKSAKARLQLRQGPPLLQPYADLRKLFRKGAVVPEVSSGVFRLAPWVVLGSTLAAAGLVPTLTAGRLGIGDALLFAGLLALGRFALALAAIDTGSNFAQMGASREMAISAVVEPALVGTLFALALTTGTTDLGLLATARAADGWASLGPGAWLAFAALVIVAVAETGRVPVDNPDTHLELTMAHEGMLLEYSGRPLGLLHYAAQVKQVAVLGLIGGLFVPWTLGGSPPLALVGWAAKLAALGLGLAAIETANAKLRILRLPDLLATAAALGGLSLVARGVLGA
ncbi:MAG TPA: NADH-quinone oxidoreductase subunit H [Chloroflexota bacterium]|nr:NADH-quinone oxidoreductase subunit H [Chloroflexota bacterium]